MTEPTQASQAQSRQFARHLASRLATGVLALIGWLALLLIVLWLIGRIATDRFYWTQWLWWIPTPAIIVISVIGFLSALRPSQRPRRRRRRLWGWCAALCAVAIYFGVVEHRFLRRAGDVGQRSDLITVAHWNFTAPPGKVSVDAIAEGFLALNADITVLTGTPSMAYREELKTQLANGQNPVGIGTVLLLSRFPIVASSPIIAAHGCLMNVVTIDTSQALGHEITVYVVDMPSNPRIGRMRLARELRRLLDHPHEFGPKLRPPDLVVGDFNIPRGSASLSTLFPSLRHAFDEAGHGYGATFHRDAPFPLYHIDHVLVAPAARTLRYELVDPGIARHYAQKAWIAPRN